MEISVHHAKCELEMNMHGWRNVTLTLIVVTFKYDPHFPETWSRSILYRADTCIAQRVYRACNVGQFESNSSLYANKIYGIIEQLHAWQV